MLYPRCLERNGKPQFPALQFLALHVLYAFDSATDPASVDGSRRVGFIMVE